MEPDECCNYVTVAGHCWLKRILASRLGKKILGGEMDGVKNLSVQLADAILMLERAKIIDFNGHFSARLPGGGGFLINSGESVRSAMRPEDIVRVDMDGQPLDGGKAPPMEVHIHAELYRARADLNAVVHTHPVWSTVLSIAGVKPEPVIMQASVLGEIASFPVISSINNRPIGEQLAAAMGSCRVGVLQSHGAVAVGASVLEAFVLAVYLEENAERQYLASRVGSVRVLTAQEIAVTARNLWKPNLLQKIWDYHHAKLAR